MKISVKELRLLHVIATKAHVQSASALDLNTWRHACVKEACGREGFSSMALSDFPAVRDYFKSILGEEIRLSARETEARHNLIKQLVQTMKHYGLAPAYLASYMSSRFARDYSTIDNVPQLVAGHYACVLRQLLWTMERAGRRKPPRLQHNP